MLVYRTSRRLRPTALLLRAFQAEADRLAVGTATHGEIRDLLVAFDELESAVADSLNPERDAEGPAQRAFRAVALEIGRLFLHSAEGHSGSLRADLHQVADLAARLFVWELPAEIPAAEAEGYAWYALYPETYLAAARRFQREVQPQKAVCLGIRQIGASLSAVVAALLAEGGCPVSLHTVRPRGHPFDRKFLPAPDFAARLRAWADQAHFLIIDEGPGLSGSSFCGVAETLSNWGIPDTRIIFFPSWIPDAAAFRSPDARRRWLRHRLFTIAPEAIRFPPLPELFPGQEQLDFSAGRWRSLLLGNAIKGPAVQPQHERRKLLLHAGGTPLPGSPAEWRQVDPRRFVLARFAGLGARGRAALERARRLAEMNLALPPIGLADGFLLLPFVPGRPLTRNDRDDAFLAAAAAYLARIRTEFPAAPEGNSERLAEMARINIGEALGSPWANSPFPPVGPGERASALDARMFPHEWLATPQGYLKVDAIDHHDDHFFPGPVDIAWDLAATGIEFRLSTGELDFLVHRYAALSGDREVHRRLPFYRRVYLAFRLGYASMAAEALAETTEGAAFRAAARRYGRLLRDSTNGDPTPPESACYTDQEASGRLP